MRPDEPDLATFYKEATTNTEPVAPYPGPPHESGTAAANGKDGKGTAADERRDDERR
jgi:hypothetical protein